MEQPTSGSSLQIKALSFQNQSCGFSYHGKTESSCHRWFSLPMIAEPTVLVLEGEDLALKWDAGGWMFHSLGGSFGSSPCSALNLFIFLLRLDRRNFGPRMMHASDLCPILPLRTWWWYSRCWPPDASSLTGGRPSYKILYSIYCVIS